MKLFNKKYIAINVSGIVLVMLISVNNISAHDVIHDIKQGVSVVIRAGYDTGEPMRYAEVLIYSPKNGKIEFQNGRTDANGSFAFLPDTPGEWKIVVNDGDGHGFSTSFTADKSMNMKITRTWFARLKKLVSGVILIFGLTGFLYYIRARKILSDKLHITSNHSG